MAQTKTQAQVQAPEAKAIARNIKTSPQKLNLVAQLIRGLKAQDALNRLQFSHKKVALDVRKALMSAIANAENNHNMDVDALVVSQAYVGKSFTLKRFAARGRGKSSRIHKPFSQVTVVVKEKAEAN